MYNDLAKWIIVAIAILGLVFNTGVVWGFVRNDLKHLRESVQSIWTEINRIKEFLLKGRDEE